MGLGKQWVLAKYGFKKIWVWEKYWCGKNMGLRNDGFVKIWITDKYKFGTNIGLGQIWVLKNLGLGQV